MIRSSQRASEPAYYIEDCQIFTQTVLIVHFQISVSTIKVAMKLQNSLIAPSSADIFHEKDFHFTWA